MINIILLIINYSESISCNLFVIKSLFFLSFFKYSLFFSAGSNIF